MALEEKSEQSNLLLPRDRGGDQLFAPRQSNCGELGNSPKMRGGRHLRAQLCRRSLEQSPGVNKAKTDRDTEMFVVLTFFYYRTLNKSNV